MAGKTQTQVYKIDLDASGLISSYRNAINQMKTAGAKASITEGMTKELDKLEKKFQELTDAGKFGVEGSKGVTTFNRKAQDLYKSLSSLGREMERVAHDSTAIDGSALKDYQKRIDELKKKMRTTFKDVGAQLKGLGFDKATVDALGKQINAQDKLNQKIKEELDYRNQLVKNQERQVNLARQGQAQSLAEQYAPKISSKEYGSATKMGGKDAKAALIQDVNQTITNGLRNLQSYQQIWSNVEQVIQRANVSSGTFFKDVGAIQDKIKLASEQVIAGMEGVTPAVQQAEQTLKNLQANRDLLGNENGAISPAAVQVVEDFGQELNRLAPIQQQIAQQTAEMRQKEDQAAIAQQNLVASTSQLIPLTEQEAQAEREMAYTMHETTSAAESTAVEISNLQRTLMSMFSITAVFNAIRNAIRKTLEDIKTLDKSFASIAMVTTKSVEEMWSSYSNYAAMAEQLGQKTDSVIKASALFYQQGLEEAEALELTSNTMKLATLAGNDYETATQEMTAAIRGFKMEMNEGAHVTDVYSTLAANAAASVDDIAQAMSRTASIANSAGMSFENTAAFLTQVIETTQESAENIGTSLKTIIARFTELKTNVAGTAESEFDDLDFNKVDTALKSVGVSLKDAQGQFRNLDEVFLELSQKWSDLDRNTQRYVATIAAGSRQQSRFIAMMDNYERTVELMDVAAESEGRADEQFAKYADTMEYKLNQLSTKWEQFRVNFLDSDFFKGFLDGLNVLMERIGQLDLSDAFDLSRVVVALPLAIKGITSFSSAIFKSFNEIKKSADTIGPYIKKSISKSVKALGKNILGRIPIKVDLDTAKLQQDLSNLQTQLQAKNDELSVLAQVKLDMNNFATVGEKVQFVNDKMLELKNTGAITAETYDAFTRKATNGMSGIASGLARAVNALNADIKNTTNEINNLTAKQQLLSVGSSLASGAMKTFGIALKSSMMPLAGVLTGTMKLSEAWKTIAVQTAIQTTALLAQTMAQKVAAAVTKATSVETIAANNGVAKSWWSVFTAENAVIWPITLIAAAIAALIGVLALATIGLQKYAKAHDDVAIATKKLAQSQKDLEEAKTAAAEAGSNNREEQKSLKRAKELKETYDELNVIQNKTVEEEEKYKEITAAIAEEFPQVVDSYDEITGKLTVHVQLWEAILKAQEQATNQASMYANATKIRELNTQQIVAENAKNLTNEKLDKISLESIRAAYTAASSSTTAGGGAGGLINLEGITEDAKKYWEQIKTSNDQTIEDFYKLVINPASDTENILDNYETLLNQERKQSEDIYNEQLELINLQKQSAYSSYYRETANVDEAIADFMGSLATEKTDKQLLKAAGIDTNILNRGYIANQLGGGVKGRNLNSSNQAFTGWDFDAWEDISAEMQKYIQLGGMDEEAYHSNLETAAGQEKIYQAAKAGAIASALNDFGQDIESQLTDAERDAIENFVNNKGTMSKDELSKFTDNFTDEDKKKISEEWRDEQLQIWEDAVTGDNGVAALVSESEDYFSTWGTDQVQAYKQAAQDVIKSAGKDKETEAKEYLSSLQQVFSKNGLNPDDTIRFLQEIDWTKANSLNASQFKEDTVKTIKEIFNISEDEATKYYNSLMEKAEEAGLFSMAGIDLTSVVEYGETVDKISKVFSQNGDKLADYFAQGAAQVEVLAEDYESVDKILRDLEKAGMKNLENVLQYNAATGKYNLQTEELQKIMNRYSSEALTNMKNQLQANKDIITENEKQIKLLDESKEGDKQQIEKLQQENDQRAVANEALEVTINNVSNLNGLLDHTVNNCKNAAYWLGKMGDYSGSFSKALSDMTSDGFLKASTIKDLQDTFRNSGINIGSMLNTDLSVDAGKFYNTLLGEIDKQIADGRYANATEEERLQLAAWRREIQMTYNEYLDKQAEFKDEAGKKQEELRKANEAYAKQLETVTEKQKKLNDTIDKYNDLVYGKDNRESGLDMLYNYDTAIEAFTDELTRAKDALSDVKTIDDATEAIQKYTGATHALLAEQRAKKTTIQAGLDSYANQIENGSVSYYDSYNGKQVSANFGDYARLDERTGRYVLDQQLLNRAKFNDDFKNLIEKNIETYNKYKTEMEKIDDEILKQEKELEEYRKQSLANYVKMEQEIADALKAAYEEQIDDLKEKYDSMKDADDDYLDALQDAIEKQRKLREKENQYEELAQKEKKLSLMQRDTSGANELETRQLEKEVQDDRQSLLDSAIDEVIDGLSKLYESQQELRDEEIELKEALLDNTAYWNSQAEGLAASFTSTEEYMNYMAGLSTEFAEMTLAQQEQKLNEYGETYAQASAYMAMVAMDNASETGDFIVDVTTVSGEEVSTIVATTAETFTSEVTRAYDETTENFKKNLQDAEAEIQSAQADLQEAVNKLAECAAAANAAAEAYRRAKEAKEDAGDWYEDNWGTPEPVENTTSFADALSRAGLNGQAQSDISKKYADSFYETAYAQPGVNKDTFWSEISAKGLKQMDLIAGDSALATDLKARSKDLKSMGIYIGSYWDDAGKERLKIMDGDAELGNWLTSWAMGGHKVKRYAQGGMVDYTGPAWVDGTPDRPESFLNAEDTARIGSAAKILSDIPLLADPDRAERIVNNSVGDTNIEIHMNIDHIDSDVDLEEVVERVKDEVVAVARPAGTNVILNQHV